MAVVEKNAAKRFKKNGVKRLWLPVVAFSILFLAVAQLVPSGFAVEDTPAGVRQEQNQAPEIAYEEFPAEPAVGTHLSELRGDPTAAFLFASDTLGSAAGPNELSAEEPEKIKGSSGISSSSPADFPPRKIIQKETLSENAKLYFQYRLLDAVSPEMTVRQEAAETVPDKIAHYLWRNFAYEPDRYLFGTDEVWQTPASFLAGGKGDCEDFAIFAYGMLKANGIHAFLLNVYGWGYGHTLCVFREKGEYRAIDGAEIRDFRSKDLKDVAYEIYPFWDKVTIAIPEAVTYQPMILLVIKRYS